MNEKKKKFKRNIYSEALRDIWCHNIIQERETEGQVDKEKYRASSAGLCFLRHIHRANDKTRKIDRDAILKMRVGTLLHEDLERSIKQNKDTFIRTIAERTGDKPINVYTEDTVELPEFNVIGHFDLVIEYEEFFDIIDYKFIHDFKYRKLFGTGKDRKTGKSIKDSDASKEYNKQILTYAMAVEKRLDKRLRHAIILYTKKSDIMSREWLVDKYEIEEAIEYWEKLKEAHETYSSYPFLPDELEPGIGYGCPFGSWECNYCDFNLKGGIGGCIDK